MALSAVGGPAAMATLLRCCKYYSLGCVLFSFSFDRHLPAYNGVVAITTDVCQPELIGGMDHLPGHGRQE